MEGKKKKKKLKKKKKTLLFWVNKRSKNRRQEVNYDVIIALTIFLYKKIGWKRVIGTVISSKHDHEDPRSAKWMFDSRNNKCNPLSIMSEKRSQIGWVRHPQYFSEVRKIRNYFHTLRQDRKYRSLAKSFHAYILIDRMWVLNFNRAVGIRPTELFRTCSVKYFNTTASIQKKIIN